MKTGKIAGSKSIVKKLGQMRKGSESSLYEIALAEEGAAEGAEHPIGPLLRRLRSRCRSGRNSSARGSRHQELGVPVGYDGVGGEVATLLEQALAVDREHGVVGNPQGQVGTW